MRITAGVLLLAILALPLGGVARGTDGTATVVRSGDDNLILEIRPAAPRRGEGRADGPIFVPASSQGLDDRGTPADPTDDLPLRRERVAIPFGAEPRLEVLEIETRRLPGPTGRAAGRRGSGGDGGVAHLALGEPGQIRYLRFAPLEVRPVVPAEGGGWQLLERALVRISWPAPAAPAAPRSDPSPLFAPLYRRAVVNPAQAGRFRGGPHEAGGPRPRLLGLGDRRVRLDVSTEGLHEVTPAWLRDAQGVEIPPGGIVPDELELKLDGEEVAIEVEAGPDGLWGTEDAAEWIRFYGVPRLGEAEADVWEQGDFTDTNVYWLAVEPGVHARVGERPSTGGSPTLLPSFPWTTRFEEDTFLLGQSLGTGVTHWYDDMIRSTDVPPLNPALFRVPLPGLAAGGAGTIGWQFLGRTTLACADDHAAYVCVGGVDDDCVAGGASVVAEEIWDGLSLKTGSAPLPAAVLTDPLDVRVAVPASHPTRCDSFDITAPDWFEVTYPRLPVARDDRLIITPEPGPWRFEIDGFSDAAGAAVWDVTDRAAPVEVLPESAGGTRVVFQDGAPAGSRFAVAAPAGFLAPDAAREEAGVDLRDPSLAARYLVIAPRSILEDANGSQALADLLAWREGQDPTLTTMAVPVEAVLDQFNEGLYDPRAVQALLAWALDPDTGWAEPPEAVLLVGDASIDMKDNLGIGGAQVPTFLFDNPTFFELGWYASEGRMGAVLGNDRIPDVLVGRIPVRTGLLLRRAVDKILGYESVAPSDPPLGWRSELVMAADDPVSGAEQVNFEGSHDAVAMELEATPYRITKYYWREYEEQAIPHTQYRDELTADLNDGALVWSYAGHGNHAKLSNNAEGAIFATVRLDPALQEAVQPADLDLIENGTSLPLLIHANCLTGQFMVAGQVSDDRGRPIPLEAMAELFVEKETGGAIAAIAPAGLTFVSQTGDIIEGAYDALILEKGTRLAGALWLDVLLRLDLLNADLEVDQTVLLGDPLVHLAVPSPSRVTGLMAVAGDKRVDLSWDPIPESAAEYVIERIRNFGDWSELDRVPGGTTDYADLDIVNGDAYYYQVRAVDPNGFPGPWSDYAEAHPLNPNPPGPPQNVIAFDEDADTIFVDWDPNPPSDEVETYQVHWGFAPDDPRLAGPQYPYAEPPLSILAPTEDRIEPVDCTRAVFLCVTATSTSGLRSECSDEVRVCGDPLGPETDPWPPSLRLRRADQDIAVDWRHVIHDIYGRDKSDVTRYDVYRQASPDLDETTATPLDALDCGAGCADDLAWLDTGVLDGDCSAGGDCLLVYSVVAVDELGQESE